MTAAWQRTRLTPEQRAERLAAAPPGGDLPPGRFVDAADGAERGPGDPRPTRWQMLLGVNPVELFLAADDPTPDDYR